jgi:hypothetical protein
MLRRFACARDNPENTRRWGGSVGGAASASAHERGSGALKIARSTRVDEGELHAKCVFSAPPSAGGGGGAGGAGGAGAAAPPPPPPSAKRGAALLRPRRGAVWQRQ